MAPAWAFEQADRESIHGDSDLMPLARTRIHGGDSRPLAIEGDSNRVAATDHDTDPLFRLRTVASR
jgi:hypothetical protein